MVEQLNNNKNKLIHNIDNLKLENLSVDELLHIYPLNSNEEDYIVPIDIAAKIKGVSKQSIYKAIEKGKLTQIGGVLLSSLLNYDVIGFNQDNKEKYMIEKEKKKEVEKSGDIIIVSSAAFAGGKQHSTVNNRWIECKVLSWSASGQPLVLRKDVPYPVPRYIWPLSLIKDFEKTRGWEIRNKAVKEKKDRKGK